MRNGFIGLVINENMKIYRRLRTWIFAGVVLLIIIAVAIIMKQLGPDVVENGWQQVVEDQIQENNETLADIDEVPAPFRAITEEGIVTENMKLEYHLTQEVNPYERNSWYFVHDGSATMMIPLIAVFVIIVASSIIASDYSTGSIKMLMIRPHYRFSILLSKYVTLLIYTFAMLCLLFFAFWLVGNVVFGFGSLTEEVIFVKNGEIVEELASIFTLKQLGLEFLSMIVLMTMTFMLATIFRGNALPIGIGIFMGYLISLDMVFAQFEFTKYLFITNLDLTYYLTNLEGKIAGTTFTFSLLVDAVYWLVFMIVTWWVFQKRDIAA